MSLPDVDAEIAILRPSQQAWVRVLLASDPGARSTHLYRPTNDVSRVRLVNLVRYLRTVQQQGSKVVLVGEAPGHVGTRRTGVPFMSEAIVRGVQPIASDFVARAQFLPSVEELPVRREVSSTSVWTTLDRLTQVPYLWAAYPHHPHQVGDLYSNRTPTPTEIESTRHVLFGFLRAFEIEVVLAVGAIAERSLGALGVACERVRHPARGGSSEFRAAVLARLASRSP